MLEEEKENANPLPYSMKERSRIKVIELGSVIMPTKESYQY